MVGEFVEVSDEVLVFGEERFDFGDAAGNGEIADTGAVSYLAGVVVRSHTQRAELADPVVGGVLPAVVVSLSESCVLLVAV